MIIKRCNFTRNLLWKLMISQEFKNLWLDRTWEQKAMITLYQRNYLNFRRRAFIFQYGVIQSYNVDKYPLSIVVHFENRRLKDKLMKILKQYEKYERMNVLQFDNVNYVTYIFICFLNRYYTQYQYHIKILILFVFLFVFLI